MKNKNDALNVFKIFLDEVENQFSRKVKRFRSDRGIKYDSEIFVEFYRAN